VSVHTVSRWLSWWQGPVWESSFWRAFQGQLLVRTTRGHFLTGVRTHFQKLFLDLSDQITKTLFFFSEITKPEIYPF
jgi:hypothetical protein